MLCGPQKVYNMLAKEIFQYLIFGTVKSEGSFEIFTICGLFGNFSKMRRRKGSFSFVSALASLCFSWKQRNKKITEREILLYNILLIFQNPNNNNGNNLKKQKMAAKTYRRWIWYKLMACARRLQMPNNTMPLTDRHKMGGLIIILLLKYKAYLCPIQYAYFYVFFIDSNTLIK